MIWNTQQIQITPKKVGEGKREKGGRQKTSNKIVDVNPNTSIITLHLNLKERDYQSGLKARF